MAFRGASLLMKSSIFSLTSKMMIITARKRMAMKKVTRNFRMMYQSNLWSPVNLSLIVFASV